ncbi:MAG: carboxypeptidase regulatory-like domain-containing protein, partial [Bacteroidota bacterium]
MASVFMFSTMSLFAQDREISGSIETGNDYVPGETMDAEFVLEVSSPDAEWAENVELTFPEEITLNSAPDITGDSYTLNFTEIDGQTVIWGPDGYLSGNGSPYTFTVNVTVPADANQDFTIDYYVHGDEWGSEPHSFEGQTNWSLTPYLPVTEFVAEVNMSSTPGNAMIDLMWENHPDAENVEKYYIYRGEENDTELYDSTDMMEFTDENVVAQETYTYQVAAVYEDGVAPKSAEQSVMALDSPIFAISPEEHEFETVGLLDGEPYYVAENQTFEVSNAGLGTLTIEQEPYFFSGNEDDYSVVLEDGTTFPYEIEGPSDETEEAFAFDVAFNPESEGSSNTLLVVRDDLDRVIRTFNLTGSAYNIPDYDLVENAFVIDQDWNTNFDYMVEDGSFEGFYNDYDLAGADDADVVYTTTVDKDSYLTIGDDTGLSDVSVFEEGDEITADNNIYEGAETAIGPGTYVMVVSGSGDYEFNVHIEGQEPVLSVDPEVMDLGEVPIGAWHPGGEFTIMNDGGQSLIINNVTTSDEEGVFSVEGHYEYPYEITTNEMNFRVYLDADEVGDYEGALLVEDEQTTHIYEIFASAYQPVEGDVFETAFEAELNDGSYTHSGSVDMPMRNNYILDNEDVSDVVYRFAYPTDGILNVTLSDIGADFNGNMQLYHLEQNRALNPLNLEPVAEGDEISDFELWQGEYFIVLSGNPDDGDYTLNLDIEDMPVPEEVTLISPEDGADDIGIEPELTWETGAYTKEVEVYLSTQYPPENVVATLDGEAESFAPEELDPSQIYFWKVVAHNENGSTESETWAFTTVLPEPLFVTGEIFDFTNVHLEWNNPLDGTIGWTEDFEEGEIPEGWMTESNATGSTAGWFVTEDGGSQYFDVPPHSYYAVTNDDAAGSGSDGSMDYLITPEQDFSNGNSATLIFDSFYTGEFGQIATVEISTDGGETWEVVEQMEAQTAWVDGYEVDLSDYIGEDYSSVWIGFHADDDGGWASGWAVDNVTVEIENDTPWSRAFLGYNIYQNGEQINEEIYTETEYDVLDLTSGTYEFGVSAVYDEGESEIVTIEEIEILGRGIVEGQVTDVDSGEGIPDATVTLAANDTLIDNYSANTDEDGYYDIEVPVVEGGYTATASAGGYEDVSEDADVQAEETINVDIVLGETPIPVSEVIATKADDDESVTVEWEAPTEFPTYEIVYDDGNANNATAWNPDFEGNMNAIKFTPSGYPATVKTAKIHIWDGTWPEGDVLNPMEVVVLDDDGPDGLPGTELGSIEVTPESPNWVTVDLSSLNISISDGDFYIANRQISTFPDCPPTAIAEDTPANRSYSYSDDTWGVADYDSFMIRAEVSGPQGNETLAYDEVEVNGTSSEGAVSVNASNKENGVYTEAAGEFNVTQEAGNNSREISAFEVYRFMEEDIDNMDNWTLLADDVTDTEYVDETWEDADMGVYYYAVKAVYTITEADPVNSNMVAKDMIANAVVIVDLNTGDSPEGAVVEFENVENDTTYSATVPADGTVQFSNFWKGNYDLSVTLDDYDAYIEEDIEIVESAFIRNVTLIETLAVPADL